MTQNSEKRRKVHKEITGGPETLHDRERDSVTAQPRGSGLPVTTGAM